MEVPKKYWWVIGIAVPIVVAVIAISPKLIPKDGGRETFYVDVVGTQFNGKVAFNNVAIVAEQTRQQLGTELSAELVEKLHKALELAQLKNFNEAIPALESVAKAAPVPAIFNNLGAAYLATGNKKKAIGSFEKALSKEPDQETARFNLRQMETVATTSKPVIHEVLEKIGGEVEPNNDILNPNLVPLETWIKGTVVEGEDVDYFKFSTPPIYRDTISIEVENRSTSLQPWVRLFDQKRSRVDQSYDNTPGANLVYSFSAEPKSVFYFFLRGNAKSAGDYSVRVLPLKRYDQYEPNDEILNAKSINLSVPVEAGVMDGPDIDYFTFTTSADIEKGVIIIENRSSSLQPWVRLFDYRKSDVGQSYDDTPGANVRHSFQAQPSSVYYFFVRGSGNSHGAYTVTVTQE